MIGLEQFAISSTKRTIPRIDAQVTATVGAEFAKEHISLPTCRFLKRQTPNDSKLYCEHAGMRRFRVGQIFIEMR